MSPDEIPVVSVTPRLRFLYTSRIQVESPLQIGDSVHGERRIIPIRGGTFSGPRMHGRVIPGGADWQVIRRDGVVELEARYTLETHDGALIYVNNRGLRHGPKEVMERLASGRRVDPGEYYFRTTPSFEVGAERYSWLNRLVALAAGDRHADEVIITVYEVT